MERPGGLPVLRLHHLGVLVRDLDEARRFYGDFLGFGADEPHESPEHDIRALLIDTGGTLLEVFAPLTPDGPISRALAKRGPGVHHVAYEAGDIGLALDACRAAGLELLDEAPRPGLHAGWRVAFIHPRSCGGVLTELVETDSPWQGVGL
jgi:methylmalonyl-CoA/ethylmalonyl-CoA epimerase